VPREALRVTTPSKKNRPGSRRCRDNDGAAVAVAISPGFMLAGVTNVKDADGAHEIELRPADIDIRAVFYELEGVVSPHEVVPGRVGASEPERAACCGGMIKERG